MRNIKLLLKNNFLCALGILRNKKSRLKSSIGIIVVTLSYLIIFALMMFTQIAQMTIYAPLGLQGNLLFMGYIMGAFIAGVFALQKITGGQKANDIELLLSMPIKKHEIMIAKSLTRVIFNFALIGLFTLPNVIAYMIYTTFSFTALIGNLFLMLCVPLIAVGLSYFVDFIVTYFFPNTKLGSVFKAIGALVITFVLVVIYEMISLNIENINVSQIVNWVVNLNPIFIFSLIAVALSIFGLGNWFYALILNHEPNEKQIKIQHRPKRAMTPFRALLKNETNRYFSSTSLMINTLIGPIGVVAVTIWLLIDRCQTIAQFIVLLNLDPNFTYGLVAIIYGFLVIMTYPAAVSISLEGKQFWILRSLPIKPKRILTAKALFNIILMSPILLICETLLCIGLKIDLIFSINLILLPMILNILVAFGGVMVNLLFPKFEFESDAALIKQSLSATIMMLCGLITQVLIILLYWALINWGLASQLIVILPLVFLCLLTGGVIILVYTFGQRIFNRL